LEDFIQNRFGYCYYEIGTNTLIYNLYVHPEYRLQGKAKMLLKHVVNEIRERGYSGEITIETAPKDETVSREKLSIFYARIGLTVI
jgi:ribosomal protein S18 acetylase RimI-like enzyme